MSRALAKLEKEKAELDKPMMAYAGIFRKPEETFLLNRGDPEQKLQQVSARIPTVFNKISKSKAERSVFHSEQERRIALANWIVNPDNPLTARVMVNRIWQNHFGRGIVNTPSDFGFNGVPPSHPELLDFLASYFIEHQWSIKAMHRLIMTSKTYQQSSQLRKEAALIDGDTRLLWRFPKRRLTAEAIRDGILKISGELNLETGGPGFNFFKTRGGLSGFPVVEELTQKELRRMVYAHKIRMEPAPVFGAFDCPDAGQPMPKRSESTTPIQALNLFNSQFVQERSIEFARKLKSDFPTSQMDQVKAAFANVLGRSPSTNELSAAMDVAKEHGLDAICRVLFNSNEFLFIP